jgi:hypothetical protein
LCDGKITAQVQAQRSVEFSCIENTKLERKEEKKLKERIVKEKTTKQPLRQASARPVGETRPKLVM